MGPAAGWVCGWCNSSPRTLVLRSGGPSSVPAIPRLGSDAGDLAGRELLDVKLCSLEGLAGQVDAMIDFSHPQASLALAHFCRDRAIPLVVGTTGFSPEQREEIEQTAAKIPLLISPNMSRAVNLLMRLVGEAARALGKSADIEIVERHHRLKKDAPSGTALRLAEIAAEAAGISRLVHGREGQVGQRSSDEIGIHAVRTGDDPGEHTVIFGLMGESPGAQPSRTQSRRFCPRCHRCGRFPGDKAARALHDGGCSGLHLQRPHVHSLPHHR